jgi:hypothetical protein
MVERLNDVGEKDDVCSESHNIANTTNDGTRNDGDGACFLKWRSKPAHQDMKRRAVEILNAAEIQEQR